MRTWARNFDGKEVMSSTGRRWRHPKRREVEILEEIADDLEKSASQAIALSMDSGKDLQRQITSPMVCNDETSWIWRHDFALRSGGVHGCLFLIFRDGWKSLYQECHTSKQGASQVFRPSTIGSCRASGLNRPQSDRAKTTGMTVRGSCQTLRSAIPKPSMIAIHSRV